MPNFKAASDAGMKLKHPDRYSKLYAFCKIQHPMSLILYHIALKKQLDFAIIRAALSGFYSTTEISAFVNTSSAAIIFTSRFMALYAFVSLMP